MFVSTVPLFASFIEGMRSYILPLIGLGIVCAIPYVIREVIDNV